ncbi:hypothetical protein D3C85_1168950 [compost metagenome]
MQILDTHPGMQTGDEHRAEQQAGRGTRRNDAGVQTALALGGVLGEKGRRPGVLAGSGKSLEQADQQQQGGRPQADMVVGGQNADAEGRHRHDQNRPGQRTAPPIFVTEVTPDQPAQRTHDKRQCEHREGRQQRRRLVGLREKRQGDDRCQITVGRIVEPLDEVAHEAGTGRPAQGLALGRQFTLLFQGGRQACALGAHCAPPVVEVQ